MGYFDSNDPQAYDSELYNKVFNRYVKLYPEAADASFEPYYSGHDSDWDEIWEEEYQKLNNERANEQYGPEPPPPPPSKKKNLPAGKAGKKKKKETKKEESTDSVGGCSQENNEKALACNYDDIYFKAGEGDDVFLGLAAGTGGYSNTFEIICGRTTDKAKLNIELGGNVTGPCGDHYNKVFYVFGDNHETKSKEATALELELASNYKDSGNLWDEREIQLNHLPEKTSIVIGKCGNAHEIKVLIYPKYEYRVDINVKYSDWTTDTNVNDKIKEEDKKKKWSEKKENTISFSKSYNGETIKLSPDLQKKYNFDGIIKLFEELTKFSHKYFGDIISFTLLLPNITGSGVWNYRLDKTNYNVYRNGSVSIKAEPLLGMSFKLSLLKVGVQAYTGPAGKWIMELPKKVAEWTNGSVELKFDVIAFSTGSISVNAEQEFAIKSLTANIICSVQFGLEISLSAKFDAYIFEITASGMGTGSAAFSMSLSMQNFFLPQGTARIGFDGLTITLTFAIEVGWLWSKTNVSVEKKWMPIDPSDFYKEDFDLNK